MRIERIESFWLRTDLGESYGWAQGRTTQREVVFVRVVTDDGIDGWGECAGPAAVVQVAVQELLGPLLLGQDPQNRELLWSQLWQAALPHGRRGPLLGALSGLDMALWDLQGKLVNLSVSTLFGGRLRERIPCFATGLYFREGPEAERIPRMLAETRHYIEAGYRAVLVQVGRSLAADTALAQALRKEFPDTPFAAEAHGAYDVPEAMIIVRALADQGFTALSDPLAAEPMASWARLAPQSRLPLSFGRYEQTRWGFESLLETSAVGTAQVNLAWCGGPSEAVKIRAAASARGVNVVPRTPGTQLNLAAALHFLASDIRQPGRAEMRPPLLEHDGIADPLRDQLFSQPVALEDGLASVPVGPGLGVTVDRAALARYCVAERVLTRAS